MVEFNGQEEILKRYVHKVLVERPKWMCCWYPNSSKEILKFQQQLYDGEGTYN